ncbi:MAG: NADH-quinone oxidoreductase subunit NuoG [Phycisphaerae bacterium]
MITIYIHNEPHRVKAGTSLLEACLSLGFNVPYFCWHPAMHSVGACRQCAVKVFRDENDTAGSIVMSCMMPVREGMRVSIDDPEAVRLRAHVVEWLMLNHPHDCPVCDEGGECHLQDMTVMTGHTVRRTRLPKRTYRNQDLGPFVTHEMNRCIQCYRCERFYRDYAGGRDFGVLGWHDGVYFGRSANGKLESEFSGNLVEVCPTGVFTDKILAGHYTRKWDLTTAPSICIHCGAGCNTIPGARYGQLRRIRARFNGQVNGYFLCDRGRYGYGFVNGPRRVREPMVRGADGRLQVVAGPETLAFAGEHIRGGRAIGIGSPRASLEANFALRSLVGPERFFQGSSPRDSALSAAILECLTRGPTPTASLSEVEACDAVVILGEDVLNVAPMLGLALRQCARRQPLETAASLNIPYWLDAANREVTQDGHGPFFIASTAATRLDGLATSAYRASPQDLARAGLAAAHRVDASCPEPAELSQDAQAFARAVAEALKSARRPLVVAGAGSGSVELIHAAADLAWALTRSGKDARLCLTAAECNSMGAALMGGGDLSAAMETLRSGAAETVIVLENDLRGRMSRRDFDEMTSLARCLIVIDHTGQATTERAHCVLPAASFVEADGTLVNNEGRAQRFFKVLPATGAIQESWRWLGELAVAAGRRLAPPWPDFDAIVADLAATLPAFKDVPAIAPPAGFRQVGGKIPRQSHRYSGRTAEAAHLSVFDNPPPADPDSPLAFSMEGSGQEPPPALIPRYWAPGWNSDAAVNKFQIEVGGPLHGGDPGRRIIQPDSASSAPYFAEGSQPPAPKAGPLWVVPRHHIFGSEPLSAAAQPIAGLCPKPYLAMNGRDAAAAGLGRGQTVEVSIGGVGYSVAVVIDDSLPPGQAALPAGIEGLEGIDLPGWGSVARAGQGEGGRP